MRKKMILKPSEMVAKLYKEIEAELGSMPSLEKTPFKTDFQTASVKISLSTIRISAVKDIDKLVEIHSHILGRSTAYNNSIKMLGVKVEPFIYNGYNLEDWTYDFKAQISFLLNEKRIEQLTDALRKLKPYLNYDEQVEEVLQTITI